MTINTFKEFLFITVFSIDVFFNVYFLYQFKKLHNKKLQDYLFLAAFCLWNIIKAMMILSILRLMFDPVGFIYRPKMTYIDFEYQELFNIYKLRLLDNYIVITALIWGIFIIYYWVNNYKKSVNNEN